MFLSETVLGNWMRFRTVRTVFCKQTWLFSLGNGISEELLALWPCVFSRTAFMSFLNGGPDRHMKEHVLESPCIISKCGARQDHMLLTSIDPTDWKKQPSGQQHHLIQGQTPLRRSSKLHEHLLIWTATQLAYREVAAYLGATQKVASF